MWAEEFWCRAHTAFTGLLVMPAGFHSQLVDGLDEVVLDIVRHNRVLLVL